jgi:hypothetical protein
MTLLLGSPTVGFTAPGPGLRFNTIFLVEFYQSVFTSTKQPTAPTTLIHLKD